MNRQKENQFQVCFEQYEHNPEFKNFWLGSKINFSGTNADYFYNLVKKGQVDWSIFKEVSLSRFDIHYFRQSTSVDSNQQVKDFMESACNRIREKSKRRKVSFDPTREPYILKVESRSSSNFFRVYLKPNGRELRFEIELKKTVVKNFQHYLFTDQFETFEELLTTHFYNQAIQLFDIDNSYCDWLVANFRQVKKPPVQEVLINSLSTSYLTEKSMHALTKVEFFYRLIQLLNYIQCLEGSSKSISMGDRTYVIFQFPVNSFLEFIGKPKTNHYQVKKLVEFLKSLQTIEPILENFSDGGFRRYVAFPYLKVERKKCWWVELSICKELYLYRYPFHLPETFLNYRDNFELKVKFILLESFCKISVQKEFPTEEFLGRVSVSTSKSAKIKNCIVRVLHELKDLKIIEPEFKILTKQNRLKEVSTLTSNLVSRSKSIFYT